jgi:peptidoglycan/xylan/chitin deacetylase (PgdA/CDA1 family)
MGPPVHYNGEFMNALPPLAAAGAACSLLAWAVRGRSASVFGRSVWRGPRDRRALALTFDDGPGESTPEILEILAEHAVPATFFQCGANVDRLPEIAFEVAARGHEIGNHSYSHPYLFLRSPGGIENELRQGAGNHRVAHRMPGPPGSARRMGRAGSAWGGRSAKCN